MKATSGREHVHESVCLDPSSRELVMDKTDLCGCDGI